MIELGLLPADYDTMVDDAFAYQSRRLLERIKQREKDREMREAA